MPLFVSSHLPSELSGDAIKYALVGATNVKFSATYLGPAPLSSQWDTTGGNSLDSDITGANDDTSGLHSVTIGTVSASATYDPRLTVTLNSPCSGTTKYEPKLEVLSEYLRVLVLQLI